MLFSRYLEKITPGVFVILVGAAGNLLLSAIKFAGGMLGGSPALINDAFHSVSDLATDGVALLTYKIGQLPSDRNHPYGHGKAESIGASLIGMVVVMAGIGLAWAAWEFFEGTGEARYQFGELFRSLSPLSLEAPVAQIAAACAVASIVINEALFRYTLHIGKREKSPSLIANAWHHRSDAFSSIAALAGILGAMAGYPALDPLAGIVVALMITKAGYDILRDAVADLMDTGLSEEDVKKYETMVLEIPGVVSAHNLRTRRTGGEVFMDLHILVNPEASVSEGHHIGENVRQRLIHEVEDIEDVLVHIDTEAPDDRVPFYPVGSHELRKMVKEALEEFDGRIHSVKTALHFRDGEVVVDVLLQPVPSLAPEDYAGLLKKTREKLETLPEIRAARTYLDLSHMP